MRLTGITTPAGVAVEIEPDLAGTPRVAICSMLADPA